MLPVAIVEGGSAFIADVQIQRLPGLIVMWRCAILPVAIFESGSAFIADVQIQRMALTNNYLSLYGGQQLL